ARAQLDARTLEDKRLEFRRHRDLLRRYLSLVRASLGKIGRNAHELAWREIRLRNRFDREQITAMEARWAPNDAADIDFSTMRENRDLLAQFGRALQAVDPSDGTPRTAWVSADRLDPFDQSKAL